MLINNDNIEALKELEDNSIDSVVTDPPYGLSFMGKKWDYDVPSKELWQEVFRVLKPGGHLLSFGGSRTYHRLALGIEDAGFEIRDQIMWVYGSGFPKSHNIGKAVDKLQGNSKWEGWGTALKPAHEPIVLARKPLAEKTVAKNVLKWGTGGINIDESRVGNGNDKIKGGCKTKGKAWNKELKMTPELKDEIYSKGRFPANFIHDGSDEVVSMFPNTKSGKAGIRTSDGFNQNSYGKGMGIKAGEFNGEYGDTGSASRFFYCAKASKSERNAGLDGFEKRFTKTMNDGIGGREHNEKQPTAYNSNHHPTVKPVALMKYLCRLITPKQGTVLDPFMGSGTTGIASKLEGFEFVGIELDKDYFEIAKARIEKYKE